MPTRPGGGLKLLGRSLAAVALLLLIGCEPVERGVSAPARTGPAPDGASALVPQDVAFRSSYDPLDVFFFQMEALRTGKQQHVRIIQLGDSHTAADFLTGELRDRLQAKFGNGGIGARAAGVPYEGIRKKDMLVSQAGRWQYHNSLTDHEFSDYGISGFTAVSNSPDASLSLAVTDPRGFDSGYVDFVRRPGGGKLEVYLDDHLVEAFQVAGPAGTLGRAQVVAPNGGAHTMRVVADRKGIEILAWDTERDDPGIVLDSFGVVSATAGIVDNWQGSLARQELGLMRPALVILAYGTNEGAQINFDPAAYQADFAGVLDKLRHWAGPSSLLVAGPTDGSRQGKNCNAGCPWKTLPALDMVRRLQFDEAVRHQVAFWNGAEIQRRSGGINAWAAMVPPLARPDHIHFTPAGYALLGQDLYRWLTDGLAAYPRARRANAAPL
ncbi:MAG TPA: hypothetical protein VGV37_13140 [Aliidongia sp.]|uniref:hypothetical protein n=1 Tax=Aliidongia sp. TaxID=1914230 RepID=UPI002DDD2057|nr:hypothetical protein [Aliidongia sp.]HEV2675482.1 hypothetical protein [Aliidongia sp.]